MKKPSKRYQKAAEGLDPRQTFSLEEAVDKLLSMPSPKFDETVEMTARLLVDPRQTNQMVRGVVALPHGSGKAVRVVVFTENPQEALDAGADHAGLEDLIAKVQEGWIDFDVAIATTSAMQEVRKVARVLGPRGLMPNPKSGTVTDDVAEGIRQVKAGRVEFKMDKTANVHVICGKRSFPREHLIENAAKIIETLGQAKPDQLKGRYIKNMSLTATMSPSLRLSPEYYASL